MYSKMIKYIFFSLFFWKSDFFSSSKFVYVGAALKACMRVGISVVQPWACVHLTEMLLATPIVARVRKGLKTLY